ncbi:MAG: hypothetical protein WCF26_20125 [Candidatus Sulfotelmatobacter sp.]
MSLRRCLVVPVVLFAFAALTGCSNNSGITNPVAPPTGSFSNSNLKGTYVFSVSGLDFNGAPYTLVGTFAANGSGGISSGTYDMNDAEFPANSIAPVADQAITGGNYAVQVDGRTRVTLNASTPFGSSGGSSGIVLDIVLQNSSHGLVTQFDVNASGSGTVDLQTAGATPTGTYAFSLSGSTISGESLAAVGNFTVGSTGLTGLIDVNEGGILPFIGGSLTGSLSVGPSATPATTLTSGALSGTFDVFAIDATHLRFIEMDATNILVGDAYAQTSTAMPVGTQAFTLAGCAPCSSSSFTPSAIGGFIVTDGSGNITNSSTQDYNIGGQASSSSTAFSGTYAPTSSSTGRYQLGGFNSSFVGGSAYAAYPSSGGLLLLEIDNAGLNIGAAYAQASGASFAASQGYGLNLTGTNNATGSEVEVDDIAEFASAASGSTITGVIDENYAPGGSPNLGLALSSGVYSGPDPSGRYSLSAAAGNQNNSTLNGGFNLYFYTADGVTFPFIDVDSSQVATGVFVEQSSSAASSSAAIKSTMFIAPPIFRPHALKKKQK